MYNSSMLVAIYSWMVQPGDGTAVKTAMPLTEYQFGSLSHWMSLEMYHKINTYLDLYHIPYLSLQKLCTVSVLVLGEETFSVSSCFLCHIWDIVILSHMGHSD